MLVAGNNEQFMRKMPCRKKLIPTSSYKHSFIAFCNNPNCCGLTDERRTSYVRRTSRLFCVCYSSNKNRLQCNLDNSLRIWIKTNDQV